jgi:hypothetical protein
MRTMPSMTARIAEDVIQFVGPQSVVQRGLLGGRQRSSLGVLCGKDVTRRTSV